MSIFCVRGGGQVCGKIVWLFSVSGLSGRCIPISETVELVFQVKMYVPSMLILLYLSVFLNFEQWTVYIWTTMLHQLIAIFHSNTLTKTAYLLVSMTDISSPEV